jgi:hypothetical protein
MTPTEPRINDLEETIESSSMWDDRPGWLIGKVVQLPDPAEALVLSIEHEFDDGTTLRYLTGPNAGELTQRDTFGVRKYEVLR